MPETPNAPALPEAAATAERIARSVGGIPPVVDGAQQQPSPAAAGNQAAKPAPTTPQPTEPDPAKGQTPAQPDPATPKADAVDPAKAAEVDHNALREALGLKPAEPETIETVKRQRAESAREAKALNDQMVAVKALLAERGLDLVVMPSTDGKPKFGARPNAKYFEKISDEDVGDIFSSLDEKQKALFAEDPAKAAQLVARKVLADVSAKRPFATTDGQEAILPENDQRNAYGSLIAERMADGKARYPDIEKPDVNEAMNVLYSDESFAPYRKLMNQSPENFRMGLSLLYNAVWRVMAPIKAAKADAEAKKKAEAEKNKQTPQAQVSGTDGTGMRTSSAPSEDPAVRIARAGMPSPR